MGDSVFSLAVALLPCSVVVSCFVFTDRYSSTLVPVCGVLSPGSCLSFVVGPGCAHCLCVVAEERRADPVFACVALLRGFVLSFAFVVALALLCCFWLTTTTTN